jgi:GNAT superfamily N-acetyltransferase
MMSSTTNDREIFMDEARIRQATSADTQDVTRLLVELECAVDGPDVRRRLRRLQDSPSDRVFLAEAGGRPVALLGMHVVPLLHRDALARITALIVTKDYRGRGIGTRLLATAERWAVEHGCTQVELNSGDHHRPAHTFYQHRGYRLDDRRFIKEDEVLLPGDS